MKKSILSVLLTLLTIFSVFAADYYKVTSVSGKVQQDTEAKRNRYKNVTVGMQLAVTDVLVIGKDSAVILTQVVKKEDARNAIILRIKGEEKGSIKSFVSNKDYNLKLRSTLIRKTTTKPTKPTKPTTSSPTTTVAENPLKNVPDWMQGLWSCKGETNVVSICSEYGEFNFIGDRRPFTNFASDEYTARISNVKITDNSCDFTLITDSGEKEIFKLSKSSDDWYSYSVTVYDEAGNILEDYSRCDCFKFE